MCQAYNLSTLIQKLAVTKYGVSYLQNWQLCEKDTRNITAVAAFDVWPKGFNVIIKP